MKEGAKQLNFSLKKKKLIYSSSSINAVLINFNLFTKSLGGIYATIYYKRHSLLKSTLLNNCRVMHLVNSKDKLKPKIFKQASPELVVESKTLLLLIIKFEKCIIRGIFKGEFKDLTLNCITIVKSFYINIILEA